MQLLKTQSTFKQFERKLFLFFIAFASTQVNFLESHLVFCLPLLCISFALGNGYLLFSSIGVFLGTLLIRDFTFLLYVGVFIILLVMMIPIYSLKTTSLAYITSFYLFMIEVLFIGSDLNQGIMMAGTTLFLSMTFLKHLSIFIHPSYILEKDDLYFIGLLLSIVVFPFYDISISLLMIWIRLIVLVVCFLSDFQTAYRLAVTFGLFLLIHNYALVEEICMFILPLSLLYFLKRATKMQIGAYYVMSHLLIPFLSTGSLQYYMIEVIVSSVCFMLLPSSIQLWVNKEVNEQKEVMNVTSQKRKMTRQLENYSDLFYRIAHSFNDMKMNTSVLSYIGAVEESLCHQCLNAKDCFNKNKGDHRLIKLLKKGIIEGLTKEEQHYVECYCLNMAQYKKKMTEQHKLYRHQREMDEEYQVLKHHLYDQLSLVGELLKNYAKNMEWQDIRSEEHLKELLEAYHYKVWFIHKEMYSLQTFRLEIGMTEITKKEVNEVVLPVLEKCLDTKLSILKMENNAHQLGYTTLVLSNHHHFEVVYGFQQVSKDHQHCGDAYLTFQHHANTIFALSDGMGYGKKAEEESNLTLDVFSRLLKSGIALDDCVQTVNALLRVKNRMEMFTTLDLVMIDTNKGDARFIKNGAMPSYIYRKGELIKVEPKALPIGIVTDLKTFQKEIQLENEDVIVMYSDGFDIGIEEVVVAVLSQYPHQVPQYLADLIMNELMSSHMIDDDATLMVLFVKKIEDNNKI